MASDAKIRIGVQGAAAAEAKLSRIKRSFESFGREVGSAFAGTAHELASMSTALSRVDPGAAAAKYRDFRNTLREISIVSGKSVADLKSHFSVLSKDLLLPDEKIADFAKSLGSATHDFGDSSRAIRSFGIEAARSGVPLQAMLPLATELHNTFNHAFDKMPGDLAAIRGAAEELGTIGGPAALRDQIMALGSSLDGIATGGKNAMARLAAVLDSLGGKNAPDAVKRRLQQQLVHFAEGGGEQLRVNLGIKSSDYRDEYGRVKLDANLMQKTRDWFLRQTHGDVGKAQQLASYQQNLGPELAAALFRPGAIEDARRAEKAAYKAQTRAFSEHGVMPTTPDDHDIGHELQTERDNRDKAGAAMNKAQHSVLDFLPDNPLARYGLMTVGGGIAGVLGRKAVESLGSIAGRGIASTIFRTGVNAGPTMLGHTGAVEVGLTGGAAAASRAIPGVALATLPFVASDSPSTEKNLEAMRAAAGPQRMHKALFGLFEYESADDRAYNQAQRAALQAGGNGGGPIAVTIVGGIPPASVTVKDDSSHPNRVVASMGGTGGRQ